ncbi:DnaB-like helicase N-terminal domain-containing protein [Streptomyces nanshensis]|uniref:DNA helicase DnaB-like N-terminal domain-containing protein n=1 Tax=Streptomyces nanshensis TaxID=518642 RepID=A0A1E7L9X9_9ACTN|nr:DnaB-like helicase N-terminal domain-containing protein [Streptomyces nanshensis]OEV13017.1 hypothetical protein AN218_05790 [Streptomyces nanshensis]
MGRLTGKTEEALFGAMLLRPVALPHMRWVPPGAFSRPDHAALWRTLHAIDFSDVTTSDVPTVVGAAVDQIEEAGLRACLRPVRLMEFVSACPNPRNAALYGGMVLDAAAHRTVEEAGMQLRQKAQSAEVDQADLALADAEHAQQRLRHLSTAWEQAPETVRNLLDTPAQTPEVAERRTRARTDVQAEADTVASLLDRPEQIRDLRQLRPEDFSDSQLASAYGAMYALDQRQAPIDTLTVAWEAQRRGDGIREDLLQTLERTSVPSAAWSGDQVLAIAALDRMDAAGHQLRNLSRIPALAPSGLIEHSETALQPVAADRDRLHATREADPAAPDPEPAPHAPDPADEMEIDV